MSTPIVTGAILVTAAVSFLAGRLLAPVEEVHHFYLPASPTGTIAPLVDAFEQQFHGLMQQPDGAPGAPGTP